MAQDAGGERLPPGRPAAGRVAGPRPEPGPSAATSPEMPVPADVDPAGQVPGTHVPDAPSPDPLFPGTLPVLPRLRLAARRRPAAAQAGPAGDWLDVLVRPDGTTALVIGHLEGSGGQLEAVAARLRASMRDALRGGATPAEALAAPGAARAGTGGVSGPAPGRGAAACVAVLDPLTGNLRYATAGLPVPVICAAAGDAGGYTPRARQAPARQVSARQVPGAAPVYAGNAVLPSGAVLLLYSGPPAGTAAGGTAAAATVEARAASVLADTGGAAVADLADRMVPAVLAGLSGDGGAGPAAVLAAHLLPARSPAGR